MKLPTIETKRILTLSSKLALGVLALGITATLIRGASNGYVALFSAEQGNFRRLVLDGIGDRRVQVVLDSLDQAIVTVWGVNERTYVGRRAYETGYLVPVTVRVEFPKKNVMSIRLAGTRFRDVVRFHVVDSDIYVIDLYTLPLPRESYFREETISSLWPNGRFEPDLTTASRGLEVAGSVRGRLEPRTAGRAAASRIPYRRVVQRAVVWAGGVSGAMFVIGLTAIWFLQRRRVYPVNKDDIQPDSAVESRQSIGSKSQVWAIMARNGALSYDEATLLAAMEREKPVVHSGR